MLQAKNATGMLIRQSLNTCSEWYNNGWETSLLLKSIDGEGQKRWNRSWGPVNQQLSLASFTTNFQEMLICTYFKEAQWPRLKVDICGIFQDASFSIRSSEQIRQSSLWEERSSIMRCTAQGPREPSGSPGFWSMVYEREYFEAEKINLQAEQKVNRGFCTGTECAYGCLCNQDINVTLYRVNTHT